MLTLKTGIAHPPLPSAVSLRHLFRRGILPAVRGTILYQLRKKQNGPTPGRWSREKERRKETRYSSFLVVVLDSVFVSFASVEGGAAFVSEEDAFFPP